MNATTDEYCRELLDAMTAARNSEDATWNALHEALAE